MCHLVSGLRGLLVPLHATNSDKNAKRKKETFKMAPVVTSIPTRAGEIDNHLCLTNRQIKITEV